MQRGAVILFEPVAGIQSKKLDFRAFGQVRWFVNDKPTGSHTGLQCHKVTVASERRLNKALQARVSARKSLPGRYPTARSLEMASKS